MQRPVGFTRRGGPATLATLVALLLPAVADSAPRSTLVDAAIERVRSEVSIRIDAASRLATYEVLEEFRNNTGRVLEGDYLYPIPANAVFRNLSLFLGETELRGEMLDADQARSIYEEIVRKRLDPALVELVGHGLVRARVFPIEAGQTRRIILRYVQVLERDGGLTRLRFPLGASRIAVGAGSVAPRPRPRPVPERPAPEVRPMPRPRPEPRTARPVRPKVSAGPGSEVSVRVRIENASSVGRPYSPSHGIRFTEGADDSRSAAFSTRVDGHRTFDLLLPATGDSLSAGLLAHAPDPDREEGYFMLHLSPPAVADRATIARDVTLVLDVSGSMAGHKIEQARDALAQMLRSLRGVDRFRLITYASVVRSFEAGLAAASAANVEQAIDWLRSVAADGGTNIDAALRAALEPTADRERLSVVVFLTDGRPTAGETDPVRIGAVAETLRDGERVFAFGLGDDVNTYVLDRLVEGGRGAVEYIGAGEEVEPVVSSLARKIGVPALADLRIVESPAALEDLVPAPLPDLFHGEELILFGRYRGSGRGRMTIEGRRGDRTERLSFDVELPRRETDNAALARLWASRKVGALTAHMRLHGPDPEVIEQIRTLGLRHGILTEYTSYLVEEPELVTDRRVMRERAEAVAQAPAQQSGAEAVRRSALGGRWLKAVAEADADALSDAVVASGDDAGWQRVGSRLFTRREGVWRDLRVDEAAPILAVRPMSAAWFSISRELPGLRSALALGDGVIIGGTGLTLRIDSGGVATLAAGDLTRLQRAFAAESR